VLEEAGVANLVELHDEESQILLPRFVQEGREFDFAFVDGDHRFDGVLLDLVYLGRLVRRGGAVVVDDYPDGPRAGRPCVGLLRRLLSSGRHVATIAACASASSSSTSTAR
jgi:predicted O-methyltransferase YrrM